jgi:hypothetical protein
VGLREHRCDVLPSCRHVPLETWQRLAHLLVQLALGRRERRNADLVGDEVDDDREAPRGRSADRFLGVDEREMLGAVAPTA